MNTYHKIQTVYKRDPNNNFKTLLEGQYSLPEFEYLKDNKWLFTEKIDGTNTRIIFTGKHIDIRGKTDKATSYEFYFNKLLYEMNNRIDKFIEVFSTTEEDICLYGEGYGAKIQRGGGNYRSDQGFILFDIKIGNWWLKRKDIEDIAKHLDIDIVPIIGEGTLDEMVEKTRNGFNSIFGNFLAEGIVARPEIELFTRNNKRIITKIKYKDFK